MLYVLYAIFFVACITLIGTVLLQPGKTDAGALFTSNVSSAAFGPRGTASILSKITIVAATVFMVVAFLISLPALQGNVSVLQSVAEEPAAPVTEEVPAVVDSNSNTTPVVDSNVAVPASNAAPASTSNTSLSSEALGQEPPANN